MPSEYNNKRYFSLWCPSWPVVSSWLTLGSKPPVPTVVFDREDNRAHVVAVCPSAYLAGVRRGMRRRSAQAIVPDAYFCVSDDLIETKTFSRVVEVVRDMVPNVSIVRPGRLECDAKGPSRYFGGEENAAQELRSRVASLGVEDIFIGVADTRFASYVAARLAPYLTSKENLFIVESGKEETQNFLSPQPLSLLDAPSIVSLLERVGLSTLGDVATMSSGDMLARFGYEGERVYNLVSAYEDEHDERLVSKYEQKLSEEYICDDPLITSSQAGFVAKGLAHKLSSRLDDLALSCGELEIETHLSNGQTVTRSWRVETSAIETLIASRVLLQCEEWLLKQGRENLEVSYADAHIYSESFPRGITRIVVIASQVIPAHKKQVSLFGLDPSRDEDALRVIERIKSLVGDENVVELNPVGGRMPGEVVEFCEYSKTFDDLINSGLKSSLFSQADESDLSCTLFWPGAIVGRSPMVDVNPPVSARLLDANNDPVCVHATGLLKSEPKFFECSAVKPSRQDVKDFAGPWPLEDAWWDEKKKRRLVRFQIVCESGAYLVTTNSKNASLIAIY